MTLTDPPAEVGQDLAALSAALDTAVAAAGALITNWPTRQGRPRNCFVGRARYSIRGH